tara:strand:- start:541 stop:699 length:159 start_codon:yes stop_codon:yes gene_type:complete
MVIENNQTVSMSVVIDQHESGPVKKNLKNLIVISTKQTIIYIIIDYAQNLWR